jgi:protein subunit release factor B
MLVQLVRSGLSWKLPRWQPYLAANHIRTLTTTTPIRREEDGDSQTQRSQWLNQFESFQQKSSAPLPKDWITTNFSRSSGPGGQNVNKGE